MHMPKNFSLVATLLAGIQGVSGLTVSWDIVSLSVQENASHYTKLGLTSPFVSAV
jgi:hypothetical protein